MNGEWSERARSQGKSWHSKKMANYALDAGKKIRIVTQYVDVVMERVEGVDFIINPDGSRDIDGSDLVKI